ncbi:tRNA (adenosine(37)-N6)-dimethylallyltransferase MiaA [Geobacter sp. FeAm09]|uniref:tRNA (adenosine(37)-N6)-dimethylallyltransferase MiaA n=1 Tax=Geobacter sp. FeAm09 TaxID=2597769 RepID=UPI0021082DC5|nr:tRNA (adenosine(37)-N6)-dimethylallyltransferase MiaA [Geobacter sp. FeAm09]
MRDRSATPHERALEDGGETAVFEQPAFNLLTVLGPTASGKTRLAVALAGELNGEIISADSRQVFRGMDIGSGKDLHEYGTIPFHLIDILDAGGEFSVFAFQRLFIEAFESITARGRLPLLCGGTGMYLDAALRGYRLAEVPEDPALRAELAPQSDAELAAMLRELRPEQHNGTDLADRRRTIRAIEIARHERSRTTAAEPLPAIRPLVIGIRWERTELRRRITERLRQRLGSGMIEEVRGLHDRGIAWERLDYYGLEYRYAGMLVRGELTRNDMFQKLNSAIHDFAKRQETWFRRMEKNGVAIHWVDGAGDPLAEARRIIRTGP